MVFGRVNYREGGGGVGLLSCAFEKKRNQTTDRNPASQMCHQHLKSCFYLKTEWVCWQWVDLAISGISILAALLLYCALITVGVNTQYISVFLYLDSMMGKNKSPSQTRIRVEKILIKS